VTIPVGGLSGLYYYGGVVGSSGTASVKKVSIARFEADSVNSTVTDHKTTLMWQQADDGVHRTWSEAKTYCNGLGLGGHADWSLPRMDQLVTIIDFSRHDPAINPAFECRPDYYWSSTTLATSPEKAWVGVFIAGTTYWYDKSDSYSYTRCVRAGPW
jgi:hypothetical protein